MRVLSPSDLVGPPPLLDGARVSIGGRVVRVDAFYFELADAFSRVAVVTERDALEVGDLVIAEGRLERDGDGAQFVRGAVFERSSPRARAHTEFGRGMRIGEALRTRGEIVAAIRDYFDDFLEVETPSIVPSPGLDTHLDAFEVRGQGFLVTSPEYQMKRLLAAGIPRCFQLARCFRRGESGERHNPEFTMLEWYRAFGSLDEVKEDTIRIVRGAMEMTEREVFEIDGVRVDLGAPFEEIPVGEAFSLFADVSFDEAIAMATSDEDRFFRLLVERVEPAIAKLGVGVFLTDYPAPFASLARLKPTDPRVAERFELYVGPVEISNGFVELTDPAEQRSRLLRDQRERGRRGLPVYPIDERFLTALEEGMPPAVGNALGLDRLVALACGARRIGDVMAFPAGWL